jgi:hypothetical protein
MKSYCGEWCKGKRGIFKDKRDVLRERCNRLHGKVELDKYHGGKMSEQCAKGK